MTSTPVAASTRRFIRPLVGIDPAQVRVHRGEDAQRVTEAHQADGVTTGHDVWLGTGQADTPETMGLLAHELTHVARRVAPRFVPPITRASVGPSAASLDSSDADTAPGPRPSLGQAPAPAWTSRDPEEQLATTVEGAVRARAAAAMSPSGTAGVETPPDVAEVSAASLPHSAAAAKGMTSSPGRGGMMHDWGGLPAPWEPLPLAAPAPGGEALPVPTAVRSTAMSSAPDATGAPAVQTAPHARTVPAADVQKADGSHSGGGADPDVDALARKVYDALKRRLAVEHRRGH